MGAGLPGRHRLQDGDTSRSGTRCSPTASPAARARRRPRRRLGPRLAEPALTPAQHRVLVALCRPFLEAQFAAPGYHREIAEELLIAVDSVKGTMRDLFEPFGTDALPQNQKRAQLALDALRTGVVSRREL